MKLNFLTVFSVLFILPVLICFSFLSDSSKAQTKIQTNDWYKKLLEKNVVYQNDACEEKDKDSVSEYFKTHQPNEKISICHNDCPVIKCRPVVPFPAVAKAVRVKGTVSVHVLADEKGKTIYARVLSGDPLMRESIRKAACNTLFQEYERKHQGVMHFLIDNYDEINVPSRANIVSQ